jgi:arylsulfatase A-like enzyme
VIRIILTWVISCTGICFSTMGKPNVILIVSEDHALSSFGAYQKAFAELDPTPELDKLASSGALFLQAFCSNAMGGPSTASLLTGKHSHANGFLADGDKFNGAQNTLPNMLKAQGYATAVFGKWDLGTEPEGFDYWEILADENEFYNPLFWSPTGNEHFEGHTTDIITDLSLKWMGEMQAKKKPFFAMIRFNATKQPWMPAIRHVNLFDDRLLPEPENLFDDLKNRAPPARYQEMEIMRNLDPYNDLFSPKPDNWDPSAALNANAVTQKNILKMNEEQSSAWQLAWRPKNEAFVRENLNNEALLRWKYQRFAKNYLRCLKGIDENVGRIVSSLSSVKNSRNLIAYTANHGRFIGEHGWFGTHWMYEETMRIPLVLSGNISFTDSQKINKTDLVQNIDLAPTILDSVKIKSPKDMHGRSLLPLLEQNSSTSADWRKVLYFHYHAFPDEQMVPKHIGIRTSSHKLIHYYQFNEWELFDLDNDPHENLNLYKNESNQKQVSELNSELDKLKTWFQDNTDISVMPEEWRKIHRGPEARKKD